MKKKDKTNSRFSAFGDLVERVETVTLRLKREGCEFPLFRGLADDSWQLLPSLFRNKNLKTPLQVFEQETAFFHDFATLASNKINSRNSWNTLYIMRHHGMPTRLLDWTENLFVALYFAVGEKFELIKNPCIYILNPYRLNQRSDKITDGSIFNPEFELKEYFDLFCKELKLSRALKLQVPKYPVAIYPFRHNDRLVAQAGLFTMHGTERKPLEVLVPECVDKIPIPPSAIQEIQTILEVSGFDSYSVYQDLDSLARSLKQFHKFPY